LLILRDQHGLGHSISSTDRHACYDTSFGSTIHAYSKTLQTDKFSCTYDVATSKRLRTSPVRKALSACAFKSHTLLFDAIQSVSETCRRVCSTTAGQSECIAWYV